MKTDAERQQAYQERRRRAGLVRLHCWATPDTRLALRDIAAREGVTVGEVLELGMLLARQHLKATPTTTAPARGHPSVIIAKPTAKPASAPPSASAPLGNTDTSRAPVEPPEGPSSSPEHTDDSDARIRAAAADAYRLEP